MDEPCGPGARDEIDVEDVVAAVAKVGQHPATGLAGAARHDDAHGPMMTDAPRGGGRLPGRGHQLRDEP